MSTTTIRRRTVPNAKPPPTSDNVQSVSIKLKQPGYGFIKGKETTLGAAALVISILSAASEFNIARQYETTLWKPVLYIAVNYGCTFLLALVMSYSPAGRSLKPGGAKMDNPKMGVIGGGCIALALGLGFGLFGPCGLLTFISISTFILLRLP